MILIAVRWRRMMSKCAVCMLFIAAFVLISGCEDCLNGPQNGNSPTAKFPTSFEKKVLIEEVTGT